MATVDECAAALRGLAARLADADERTRERLVERTLACTVTDLDTTFRGRLGRDGLGEIETGTADGAQVRLRVSSDDLVALTNGTLSFPQAWLTGRLKISAGMGDLLLLRSLL